MTTIPVKELHKLLEDAAIPILGVSLSESDKSVVVQYKETATAGEKAAAEALVATFKSRKERKPRSLSDLVTAITALSAQDRAKLQIAIAAEWLQSNPGAARKLGIDLDGDEEVK